MVVYSSIENVSQLIQELPVFTRSIPTASSFYSCIDIAERMPCYIRKSSNKAKVFQYACFCGDPRLWL